MIRLPSFARHLRQIGRLKWSSLLIQAVELVFRIVLLSSQFSRVVVSFIPRSVGSITSEPVCKKNPE